MKNLALALAALFLFALPMTPIQAQSTGCGGNGTQFSIFDLQSTNNCTNVPEPSSFVLLAAGLGALGILFVFRQYRISKTANR